jgi:hypothetical protein
LSGSAANVRLMMSSDFSSYRTGRRHSYYGGLIKTSRWRQQVPHSGHWHVTVDMNGLRGTTRSGVRVYDTPAPLPPARSQGMPSLRSIGVSDTPPSEAAAGIDIRPPEKAWDVFVSHASEDKEDLVRPLARALEAGGLSVWYDETELRIGDSLRRKIDSGLARSRFGVVVLSHAFFKKNWPQYELDGLVTREMTGEQVILPLWHNISKTELIAVSPSLADKVALSTANYTVEEIAAALADRISNP